MKTRYVLITLFALCMHATSIHAATSGAIRFSGLVYEPASAAVTFDASKHRQLEQTRQTCSLSTAQAVLLSDVLNYFATYAPKDAKLVSVVYL
jgi:hypothetical protein